MSKFVLTTESTCDIWRSYQDREDLGFISLSFTVDGNSIFDNDESVSPHDFYDMMREGKRPNTSLVNFESFTEFFEGYLKKGVDVLTFLFRARFPAPATTLFWRQRS